MNILCISHEYLPIGGGGSTACHNISKECVRYGHEVTVITASYGELAKSEYDNGIKILRVPCKRKNSHHSSFNEMLSYLFPAFLKQDVC